MRSCGNPPQQVDAIAQPLIAAYGALHFVQQRCARKATPQLQSRQGCDRPADSVENGERILVRVQMPHPQEERPPCRSREALRLRLARRA